ncbi:hypothetical protein EUTSA_v10017722mg [Eutrema salsugineum]|uniref:Phorbol-ester/DAG-type domain-containing protein n=1 Tax=Eutrema salsugineum TaxID=72664 RepID=V4M5Q0_EUTSA|nr:uncharacterized protein LOC18026661 [Eutrema salsugineum]ESQ51554.1 hypothetical protein EUTSA_v10017722mg [Eutrema salsugineum]
MALQTLKHFSHECDLTSPKIVTYNVCNICYKEEPVKFECRPCNFDLCLSCSELPEKVHHDFHREHPLELCLFKYNRKPKYIVCSGCGEMSCGSFYKCKTCEIYLDLGCALRDNITDSWDVKELLHDSHCHLLRRCRPGSDAKGSCLLCELPVSPSSICYGCIHCYSFVHQKCLDLPTEIQHSVHPAHPLKRLSYLRTFGCKTFCSACKSAILGVSYSCRKCDIDLHLRCMDSLLRGLMHESHKHRLFYVATGARYAIDKKSPCQICMETSAISLDSYYHCVECNMKFHFECLGIPKSLVKKSFHTHPLVCKTFLGNDHESLEYCGVCETMVHAEHDAYSCQECDYRGHIECILRKEEPSPMYLKDLYLRGREGSTRATNQEGDETNILETKLMVNDVAHIHVMKLIHMSDLDEKAICEICREKIRENPCKCTSCSFQTHHFCAELGQPWKNRLLHREHPLTLLPNPPTRELMNCNSCRLPLLGFIIFCRICNFVIDINCALRGKQSLGMLGKKVIGESGGRCVNDKHVIVQVMVSRSYMTDCAICFEKLYGKALSCMTCGEIYHSRCMEVWRKPICDHPLHSDHKLFARVIASGANCIACKMNIPKHGYSCYVCKISFHIECIKAVDISSSKFKPHIHYLYNFWMEDLRLTQACSVCATPCGVSFYGCVDCSFNAHVECIGIATNVKSPQHKHSVEPKYISDERSCSLCGSECSYHTCYCCKHCNDVFHIKCLMPLDDRKAATEEEQVCDIYLMYLERNLLDLLDDTESLILPQL